MVAAVRFALPQPPPLAANAGEEGTRTAPVSTAAATTMFLTDLPIFTGAQSVIGDANAADSLLVTRRTSPVIDVTHVSRRRAVTQALTSMTDSNLPPVRAAGEVCRPNVGDSLNVYPQCLKLDIQNRAKSILLRIIDVDVLWYVSVRIGASFGTQRARHTMALNLARCRIVALHMTGSRLRVI